MTGPSESRGTALDALASAMAGPVSRRRMLRISAAALAAATLPSWIWRPAVAGAGVVGKLGDCVQLPGVSQCDPDQFEVPYTSDQPMPPDTQVAPNGKASTFNGCGPAAGIDIGPLHGLEPWDSPLGLAHFVGACNTHDCCYGSCQQSKSECDSNFLESLSSACDQSPTNLLTGVGLGYCNTIAAIYYAAVAVGGGDAYTTAQREACIACRPRCQCAGTTACCEAPSNYTCFDQMTDRNNCGDCGIQCSPGQACVGGWCV